MHQRNHKRPPRHGINVSIIYAVGSIDADDGGKQRPRAKGAGREGRHLNRTYGAGPAIDAASQVEARADVGLDAVENGQEGDLFARWVDAEPCC